MAAARIPFPSGLGYYYLQYIIIRRSIVTINEKHFLSKPFSNIKLPWKE
jgi:hypothetical protein